MGQFDSRSPEFKWADVQITMQGRVVTRARGVKFTIKKDKEYFYGRGEDPHTIQSGNKTPEGEITLAQSEVEAMQANLSPHEDLTDLAGFDVTVAFVPKTTGKMSAYTLKGVEVTEDTRESKQGDKFNEITLPIMFLKRVATK